MHKHSNFEKIKQNAALIGLSVFMAFSVFTPVYAEDSGNTNPSPTPTSETEDVDNADSTYEDDEAITDEATDASTDSSDASAASADTTETENANTDDSQKEEAEEDSTKKQSSDYTEGTADETEKEAADRVKNTGKLLFRNMAMAKAPSKAPVSSTGSAPANIEIRDLNTTLFYGAEHQEDGTYLWNVPNSYDSIKPGHRFAYRINFAIGGVDKAPADSVHFTIPRTTLKDRSGNSADTVEWSIPSKTEITTTTTDANGNTVETVNTDDIDADVNYAYYLDGDNYVIYNFREVPAGDNGYIEVAYVTSESTTSYKDMEKMNPFTCILTVGDGTGTDQTKTTKPIITAINTTAEITSTYKRYPYDGKIKEWRDSWGTAVKPDDPTQWYYLEWSIRSDINATQPYDFRIEDTLTSNLGGMVVLGYKYAGESTYSANHTVTNQTANGYRWDSVLTAIPLSTYANEGYWEADNKETATVTPTDKVDKPTNASSSQKWSWTKPVFHEPTGHFNAYKRADGAYRRYCPYNSIFTGTQHIANSLDFRGGNYSRYDLEQFNGWNGEAKTITGPYDKFDYASWMVGYPIPWTRDTSDASYNADEPWTAYGHKPVKFELVDDGVFLLNDESGFKSDDGSTARTIENGGLDSSKAMKLTSNDFKIYKLQFSTLLQDADYDSLETGEWQTKSATLNDNDILVFEGKFDGSDDWTQFATYNLKTQTASPNADYVSSMSNREIVFNDNKSLTAYRVTTANAHYYTEVYTVPFMELKNTDAVQNWIKNSRNIAIVNNNQGNFYELNDGVTYNNANYTELMANGDNWKNIVSVYHSDTDYAEAAEKNSSLEKTVISTSNLTRKRQYEIGWKITQSEKIKSGEDGKESYIPQQSGIFYDLLPVGNTFVNDSVQVQGGNKILSDSDVDVKTISNYQNTGRTMLVIKANKEADYYITTFSTRMSWNAIKDFGSNVYNPVAYETGNDSISKGFPDNGGIRHKNAQADTTDHIKDYEAMQNLSTQTGQTKEPVQDEKFIYSEKTFDIQALTAASAGLMKKIKAKEDNAYSYSTMTHINGEYSYALRFMNSTTSATKDMVLIDSLENYDSDTMRDYGTQSDWRGTLQSIDVSMLRALGAEPVVYISTVEKLNPEIYKDDNGQKISDALKDASQWTKVTDLSDSATLSAAKAVAIDFRKKTDGSDFVLKQGQSVDAYLYMKAPAAAPNPKSGEGYPYAYNNIYISDTVMNSDTAASGQHFLIHQDYTKIGLKVAGNISLHKINSQTNSGISGISFRLYGKSAYGTNVDETKKTDSNGNITFDSIEKGDNYILQETDSTDDYLIDATERRVRIDGTGRTWIDDVDCTDNAPTYPNTPRVHTDISFTKADSNFTVKHVNGATYRLSGRSDYGTDVLKTATCDEMDGTTAVGRYTFRNVEKGTYKLKETQAPAGYMIDPVEYTVIVDGNANYTINGNERDVYQGIATTAYSYTENLNDDGTQNSSYGNSWTNSNIRGTDRDAANSQAHVITIPGASKLHVKITWGGESSNWDWVSVWQGSHPDYTASNNNSTAISGAQKLGGGSHTAAANTKEFDVDGDSVTFGYRSDGSGSGDGYGYYAVVTDANYKKLGTTTEAVQDKNGYRLPEEPLHYISFTKQSSYDNKTLQGAKFELKGIGSDGTVVDKTAESEAETGTVKIEDLPSGTYVLQETEAPAGFEKDNSKRIVQLNSDDTYTISGLNKDNNGTYVWYNTKLQDKQITVKKVWDDGLKHTNPNDLAITITTDVPQQSTRTYTIIYYANGGTFGDSNSAGGQ